MSSPWLSVPLSDYEGHMNDPGVAQLHVLSALFADALAGNVPKSIAILGIAGGNGLEHIDASGTDRIVGVDVNPEYLEAVRIRYAPLPNLELHCVDLTDSGACSLGTVAWVHAALLFEHAGLDPCLANAVNMVAPDGVLSVVLQLPTRSSHDLASTSFTSMQQLKSGFALIDPADFTNRMRAHGFQPLRESSCELPGGKGFWLAVFQRCSTDRTQVSGA